MDIRWAAKTVQCDSFHSIRVKNYFKYYTIMIYTIIRWCVVKGFVMENETSMMVFISKPFCLVSVF